MVMLSTSIDQVTVRLDLDPWLSLRAAASYCGLSIRFLRGRIAEGVLPHYRPGGKVLIRRSHLDTWLEQFKRVGTQDVDALVNDVLADLRGESNKELYGQRQRTSQRTSARSGSRDTRGKTVGATVAGESRNCPVQGEERTR